MPAEATQIIESIKCHSNFSQNSSQFDSLCYCFHYFSIARGQKIPIFSAAGLPHNDVSVQE